MTSARKKANRANAQSEHRTRQSSRGTECTPPRIESVISDPVLSEEVEALAREIAGEDARHQFLSNELNDPY
jgi:hypothetical protein